MGLHLAVESFDEAIFAIVHSYHLLSNYSSH